MDIDWTRWEGDNRISGAQLSRLHALKTGALIQASAEEGAILGGGQSSHVAALRDYGAHLGRSFQIWDDVLDVEGDPEIMGKASTDAANDKMTFPALYGLEKTKTMALEARDCAVSALDDFGAEADGLRALARFVVTRNKIKISHQGHQEHTKGHKEIGVTQLGNFEREHEPISRLCASRSSVRICNCVTPKKNKRVLS